MIIRDYKGFHGSFYKDPKTGICHGRIFGIRDLVTYQSDSEEEMQKEFEAAVDDYIETKKELQLKEVPKNSKKKFLVKKAFRNFLKIF